MKNIVFVLVAPYNVFTVCAKPVSSKADKFFIYGRVNNFERFKDSANSVQFHVNNIVTGYPKTYNAKLANDGSFNIVIKTCYTHEIYLEYNRILVSMMISPGKQVKLLFNANSPESSICYSGKYGSVNNDFKDYLAARDKDYNKLYGADRFERYRRLTESEKNEPDAHKKFLLDRFNIENAIKNEYLYTHKINKTVVLWAEADLKYEYADNLMRYVWMRPIVNKKIIKGYSPGDKYYDFFAKFNPDYQAASISSYYGDYLSEYKRYITEKNEKTYDTKIRMNFYKNQPPYLRDVMTCQFLYGFIESKNLDVYASLQNSFKTSAIRQPFKDEITALYNQEMAPRRNARMPHGALFSKLPKTETDSLFDKIVAKYPNKVIYVDFWATWCGPCRAEMPNSQKLQTAFKDQDIVFVYLALQSKEATWKSSIAEMGLNGEHFLLNNNEYQTLANKFNISGIPHYVLVNRKGNVFDANAKRPDDDKLKPELAELLKER